MKLILKDLCESTKNNNPSFEDRAKESKVAGLRSRKNFRRFIFLVKSKLPNSSKKGHLVTILFPTLSLDILKKNKNLLPIDTRVRCWCTCPAFQYWGSAYNATHLKYNLTGFSESRAPNVRDPNQHNYVCKHVYAVYKRIEADNFIRLYNKFKQAYYRKTKKKSNNIENDILLYLYNHLMDIKKDHREVMSLLNALINEDLIESYLKELGLII